MNNTKINPSVQENKKTVPSPKINYPTLFWLFLFGSVVGFLLEGIWCILKNGAWENHTAAVWGPFCIIYGIGSVAAYMVSVWIDGKNLFLQFLLFAFSGALVEYLASLFQELCFGSTSWNYTADFMNIGGRTSLMMMLIWGGLGTLFAQLVFPRLQRIFEKLQSKSWRIVCMILTVFMAADLLLTAAAILRWRSRLTDDIPASNMVERYLDENYDNNRMNELFSNMVFSRKIS